MSEKYETTAAAYPSPSPLWSIGIGRVIDRVHDELGGTCDVFRRKNVKFRGLVRDSMIFHSITFPTEDGEQRTGLVFVMDKSQSDFHKVPQFYVTLASVLNCSKAPKSPVLRDKLRRKIVDETENRFKYILRTFNPAQLHGEDERIIDEIFDKRHTERTGRTIETATRTAELPKLDPKLTAEQEKTFENTKQELFTKSNVEDNTK